MPELSFEIAGLRTAQSSLAPLLQFKLRIANSPADETVQAILLNTQIQIQSPQRHYTTREKENLVELFGPPEMWGQTLRNRLWASASTTVGSFRGCIETILPVPCTSDFNLASTRYFNGLEGGDVPLLFLFSGTIFYSNATNRLQVTPISWNSECTWRMPAQAWRDLMERHFPNTAWLSLQRDIFDRLSAYKRENGILTWEDTFAQLLDASHATRDTQPVEVSV